MGALKAENIPKEALDIHKQNEQFRSYITSLDYTVDSYNKILKTASAEEKPLIKNEMDKIDTDLEKGEKNLKWNSPGIGDYINEIRKKVSDLETRLQKSKLNTEKIQALKVPLLIPTSSSSSKPTSPVIQTLTSGKSGC